MTSKESEDRSQKSESAALGFASILHTGQCLLPIAYCFRLFPSP